MSQSDNGRLVFGGDIDGYNSYAQRGNMPVVEDVAEGGMYLMPMIGRARLLRSWGGIMDMSMEGSPIIDRTHIDGLYFNGGWCYGGCGVSKGDQIGDFYLKIIIGLPEGDYTKLHELLQQWQDYEKPPSRRG